MPTRFSLRYSIQRIACPVCLAAQATAMASLSTATLAPKPPPTSGVITRIAVGSSPSAPARAPRASCAFWVLDQIVSRSPAQDAAPGRATLEDDWRDQLPGRLLAMATAWHAPQAWEGLTKVGGGTMPAPIAGQAGLNELVIHGWDLARATGQPYRSNEASALASAEFLALAAAAAEPGQPGPFGPAVDVPPGAPVLDRAIGLSGRDPHWPGA